MDHFYLIYGEFTQSVLGQDNFIGNAYVTYLPLNKNNRYFTDDIFWCIFVNGKLCILI